MALGIPVANARECLDVIEERLKWLDAIAFLLLTQEEISHQMIDNEDIANIASLMRDLQDGIKEASELLEDFCFSKPVTKEE